MVQDVYKIRAVDTVHINPSVLEGERGYFSILGPHRAIALARYAPVFLFLPTISGDPGIPSTITCYPGVIDAAPRPQLVYEWKLDGVPVGTDSDTILTQSGWEDQTLTCEVTATNTEGFALGISSNSIMLELIEPARVEEFSVYSITGLNQVPAINLMGEDTYITTGMWVDDRLDMENFDSMILTGLGGEDRLDIENIDALILTGLGSEDKVTIYNQEVYVVWQPSFLENLAIVNPGAETGDMTGWTISSGGVDAVASAFGAGTMTNGGSYFFKGHDVPAEDSIMYQVVDVNAAYNAEIDLGNVWANPIMLIDSGAGQDGVRITLQFEDGVGAYIDAHAEPLHLHPNGESWKRYAAENMILLPVGTRKIRVIISFMLSPVLYREENNGYVDDITVELYQGPA